MGRLQLAGEAVFGAHAVASALLHRSRPKFHSLLLQQTGRGRGAAAVSGQSKARQDQMLRTAQTMGIPTVSASKHDLDLICGGRPHQGVVLDCAELAPGVVHLDELQLLASRSEPSLIVALDEVHDPQNLGAILRTSAYFGVDMVLLSPKNSSPLSPTVSKASAGACEMLVGTDRLKYLAREDNMPSVLRAAAPMGFRVMGTDLGPHTVCASELQRDSATIVVFGNEGHGLRRNVSASCTQLVKIPSFPSEGTQELTGLDSLNVSVSVGVMLWALKPGPVLS
eukprot:TRINITY_DN16577_c0_g1_i2.p1 TRINITY_DN16577_c0_g1~~TRINITY_DN16577_c0_g1_i2.p1  ORF type:complete len:282 (-),score=42.94 TRINITY_DN16577_c0_g1_i2:81-926(-)